MRFYNSGSYVLASWLFLRLLGLIYLAAFVSLAVQIRGLVGANGILPVADLLRLQTEGRSRRWWRVPTLCWFSSSDRALVLQCWGGAILAVALTIGIAPRVALPLLWALYLSLLAACWLFLGYQWDILLLETGFLSIFLAPAGLWPKWPGAQAPSHLILWLMWWLLFRLMFSSGMVKLRSRDPTWRNFTALCHHYQTQPLPTPLAWHVSQLPPRFHKASAALMFGIELLAPFLLWGPPSARRTAAALFILLMVLIQVTGNYCFFNLLGIALSLLLLDDAVLGPVFDKLVPTWNNERWVALPHPAQRDGSVAGAGGTPALLWGLALIIFALSVPRLLLLFRLDIIWPRMVEFVLEYLEPFHFVNSYGLFAVMTTERPEIIVEGSDDGLTWRAYEFRWKPGDVKRAPKFVAPHQPRLDWQMWFAALGYYQNNPWFTRLLRRLLEGSPTVLALLRNNPFEARPPRFLRAVICDYRFTNRTERQTTGAWWKSERRGLYCPILDRG
ncbi:MAG: membrane protein [Verrucomicrobia bacterium]|nr:MAG: membrane protein [Verrucomicrobiota bacterium]